ncbi:OXA-48 family carbapenem-hydrolyzing class D beta-lactamase OXA-54 [Nemorincola caseinilytica]|uniref:beta-lactamase n=1 Tax=Nemorincola caseinilytica TaxID=2054315 RepID=A0ABP8NLQ5_9BACT
MLSRISIVFLFALVMVSCRDARIIEHKEWAKVYEENGIKDACFILRDNNHESIHYYNLERCSQRFLPASTFKIFNSLVALETAVAPDERLVIKYDTAYGGREEWRKDMDMREAMKVSCLWYYREIARRIGPDRMKRYIDTIKYGNMNISGQIDMFWLNDSLQISADEQAGFVKRLYFAELPVSERSQRIVRNIMLREEGPGYKLYYKTGTGEIKGGKYIYWVTGFVERIEHVKEPKGSMNKTDIRMYPYFFSQNFEMPVADTSRNWFDTRIAITKTILKQYGALPKE